MILANERGAWPPLRIGRRHRRTARIDAAPRSMALDRRWAMPHAAA
ncbi:hypothetical protein BURPS668_A1941 [Burkholderia pseudomallei 668]|nr:hypothetical protein BURPS668_A1941 [Burkholderia pseudomallei 668]